MDVPHLLVSDNVVAETVLPQQSAPTSAPLAPGEDPLPREEIIVQQTAAANNLNAAAPPPSHQLPKENGQVSFYTDD